MKYGLQQPARFETPPALAPHRLDMVFHMMLQSRPRPTMPKGLLKSLERLFRLCSSETAAGRRLRTLATARKAAVRHYRKRVNAPGDAGMWRINIASVQETGLQNFNKFPIWRSVFQPGGNAGAPNGYCSQSAHHETGLKASKLMEVQRCHRRGQAPAGRSASSGWGDRAR